MKKNKNLEEYEDKRNCFISIGPFTTDEKCVLVKLRGIIDLKIFP